MDEGIFQVIISEISATLFSKISGQADLLQSIQGFRKGLGGLKHIDADLEKPAVSQRSQMIMSLQGNAKANLRHVSVNGFEKDKRHYSEEDELFQDGF